MPRWCAIGREVDSASNCLTVGTARRLGGSAFRDEPSLRCAWRSRRCGSRLSIAAGARSTGRSDRGVGVGNNVCRMWSIGAWRFGCSTARDLPAARRSGATVHTGGEPLAREGYFYPPTILSGGHRVGSRGGLREYGLGVGRTSVPPISVPQLSARRGECRPRHSAARHGRATALRASPMLHAARRARAALQ